MTTAPRAQAQGLPPSIKTADLKKHGVSILLEGPEKSGKTHFWCSMPGPIVAAYTDPNRATPEGFMADGREIELIPIRDWKTYQNHFIPAVMNRKLEARTIVVDSYTYFGDKLPMEMAGGDGKVAIHTWGRIKELHWSAMMDLVNATGPGPNGEPGYNIVVTCHLMDIQDDNGSLIKVRPQITGGFRDAIGKQFDSVFIAASEAVNEVKDGRRQLVGKRHFLWTIPPDRYHSCGDGIGGKGGRKELPPQVENTWQAVCRGWGVDPDTMGAPPRTAVTQQA